MSFTPDRRVLAVTSLIGVAVGIVMSALPIWVAMRRRAGAHVTWDRTIVGTTSRWGRGLLVVQVALSVVMLVGAALLTRSLYLLQNADLGIRTAGILNVKLFTLPNAPYNRARRASYYPPLLETDRGAAGRALGGVRARAFPRDDDDARDADHVSRRRARGVETSSDYASPRSSSPRWAFRCSPDGAHLVGHVADAACRRRQREPGARALRRRRRARASIRSGRCPSTRKW